MKNKTPFPVALVAAVALIGSGCAALQTMLADVDIEKLDAIYQEWLAKYEAEGGTFGNAVDVVKDKIEEAKEDPDTSSIDEVDFAKMVWCYGGFNGAGAKHTDGQAQIKNLVVTDASAGGKVSYQWVTKMSAWGFGDSDICAIVAVFFKCDDGVWRGGKFDHISTSRTSRDLKHCASYKNWTLKGVSKNAPVAFVIVQYDGKRRTNILLGGGK